MSHPEWWTAFLTGCGVLAAIASPVFGAIFYYLRKIHAATFLLREHERRISKVERENSGFGKSISRILERLKMRPSPGQQEDAAC